VLGQPRDVGGGRGADEGERPAGRALAAWFGELYDAHAHELLRWLQARTYSAEVAADLCAETFAVALEQFDRFDPGRGAAAAWLWGIARNHLRHFHRSESVDRRARERLGVRTPLVADDDLDLIDDRVDAQRRAQEIEATLARLSPKLALAVRTRVVEQEPYDVVARVCACSEPAARARVSRGLTELLDELDGHDRGEVAG
jgi:RNA polymerase sigma factor (sigma-70 family)